MNNHYDIIVVGGGHAGIEAAIISAKKKTKILLISNNIDNIGSLSCNPSIGGVGKGKLIKELNSMGGIMGKLADYSGIQYKSLNSSKGEAVLSTRIQVDRIKYKKYTNKFIKLYKNLYIKQETVINLLINNNEILGVKTNIKKYYSKIVILTTGTFLNGNIYIGLKKIKGGRINEKIKNNLANQLKEFNFYGGRLKTGTPPRINKYTINFNLLKKQKGDSNPIPCFTNKINKKKQELCWMTKTNIKTHEIIKKSLNKSPIFNENLSGISPRYCPSIEDKIYKFYNKKFHNIFLEPESKNSLEYYPNGISTSLPYNIQKNFLNSINGLEKTEIIRPGYGVEYDFFSPKNLKNTLESKTIKNLFFAGQINGTTGYEEAAVQGFIAGINSVLIIKEKTISYNKKKSYIRLMINDLIKNGVTEPYRIFNNSEEKIEIREDNSDERLIYEINLKKSNNINYINKNLFNVFLFKKIINDKKKYIFNILNIIYENKINKIRKKIKIYKKYKNYIKKNKNINNIENINLKNINYFNIKSLSKEISEKLNKIKPKKVKNLLKISKINKSIIYKIIKNQKII
ncbi:tRNA uridine 5-carboxymethylaminomethyl modification enzyme GidA [Candidatus Nasuia deltocephalinicola]|nr:tRNA uridine 5-carboxymethylaminomethyl modification enzyme GidA [Candidatus Nasuia deltocephalinicola]